MLKGLGLSAGDRVAIYMPMIPELPVAMLACTRIGVAHSVIFGGFSPDAIVDRCEDAEARLIITADAGYRRGAPSMLKPNVDTALSQGGASVEHVVVVNRCDTDVDMAEGRDLWWHELMADAEADCPPEPMDSEALLYLLYTSGTTAKPKGIMHTTGGYLTQVAFTHKYVFDLKPDTDVYWCAADIGWVTGHSYIVYGPLANGATSVIYEGTPDTPSRDRLWDIVARYGVTQLYTAPTAIRTFMKWGAQEPAKHDLSSLRVLGTVGEPINPEAWMWYHTHIGGSSCPIVDTWWQTETGGHMISPLPGVTTTKPGSATHTIPGVFAELVDDDGYPVERGGGYLTITRPWPSMLRGIWGDPERYRETYWSRFEGRYFAGDGAKAGRRRLPVAAGPGGRRDEHLRPPHLHHRGGIGVWWTTPRWPRPRWWARPTTPPARPSSATSSCGAATTPPTSWARRSASTWPPNWAPSPGPRRWCWSPTCPRPARARSCAACCAMWPRAAAWATPPPWPTSRWWTRSEPEPPSPPKKIEPSNAGPSHWTWRDSTYRRRPRRDRGRRRSHLRRQQPPALGPSSPLG